MKEYKLIFSAREPHNRNCVWAKPVVGGFTFYLLENGVMQPLKLVDDKNTTDMSDDTAAAFDEAGAAAAAQEAAALDATSKANAAQQAAEATVTGTVQDTSEDLTLYGLKAYIDEKIAEVTPEDAEE